jgi:radical SAM protein with 4Fe4S-binding SPASM domain
MRLYSNNNIDVSNEDAMASVICARPFRYIDILPDGEVFPCTAHFTNYSFGNVFKDSFDEVWNGEKAREFRRSIINGTYKYCKRQFCLIACNQNSTDDFDFYPKEGVKCNQFSEISPLPKTVKFSHDFQCNVRCVMCRDKQIYNAPEIVEKLDEKINTVFCPICQNATSVILNGCGEALASKHMRNLIKAIAIKYPRIKFHLLTNGLLVDKENLEELKIIDKIRNITFSLHAANKKTYEKIVLDSDYDRLMRNIEWAHEMLKAGKFGKISISVIVSIINYKEMVDLVKLAKKNDAYINFIAHVKWDTQLGRRVKKADIFEKKHLFYNSFVKIMQNDIFSYERCIIGPHFKNMEYITFIEWMKYRIEDFKSFFTKYWRR